MIIKSKYSFWILFLFIFFCKTAISQLRLDTLGWRPPVDIPIYLSGNFAELRSGHFHAGIDIKTNGREGLKLHAVQDGYVSRIKVSPRGYGKAIYITHPDGYTSVYGHLSEFNIHLDKYVKEQQYKKESFAVDLFPEPNMFTVQQGDVIGLTGNSGGSAGPHLHFEIRDTRTANPLNGLFLGYDIKDNIAPKMYYLYVYPKSPGSHVNGIHDKHFYSLKKLNGHYKLRQGDTLNAFGQIGLGLKANDFLNGSYNRCGIYQIKVFVNNQLYFQNKFDSFSFSESKYINSLMDYEENVNIGRKLQKLYIDPNNKLSVYVAAKNRGLLYVEKNKIYNVHIEAVDAQGNQSTLNFCIKGTKPVSVATPVNKGYIIPWQDAFALDTLDLKLKIAKQAFYDMVLLHVQIDTNRLPGTYSPVFSLNDVAIPIHKSFDIEIAYDSVPDSLQYKLLIAKYKNNHFIPMGGYATDGVIQAKVRAIANYVVTIDSTPPVIKPFGSWIRNRDLTNETQIKFYLSDNLSGIHVYRGFINDNWVLFEWDPKNNYLFYNFDELMPNAGDVEVRLEVWDERGNFSIFKTTCVRNRL